MCLGKATEICFLRSNHIGVLITLFTIPKSKRAVTRLQVKQVTALRFDLFLKESSNCVKNVMNAFYEAAQETVVNSSAKTANTSLAAHIALTIFPHVNMNGRNWNRLFFFFSAAVTNTVLMTFGLTGRLDICYPFTEVMTKSICITIRICPAADFTCMRCIALLCTSWLRFNRFITMKMDISESAKELAKLQEDTVEELNNLSKETFMNLR